MGDELVSTVYIGFPGSPSGMLEYETMVFGDYDEGIQVRYKTKRLAKKGYWKIVNQLRQDFFLNV